MMNRQTLRIFVFTSLITLLTMVSTVCARQGVVQELSSEKLFFDNFDDGIKANWNAVEGKWRMVNGTLRPVEGATAKVRLDGFELSEGVIEFAAGNLEWNNDFRIGIKRQENSDAGYWFMFNNEKIMCYAEKEDGKKTEFYLAGFNSYPSRVFTTRIEMHKNIVKLFADGEIMCSFSDDTFDSGFISFYVTPRDEKNPYPWIDDFTVYEK